MIVIGIDPGTQRTGYAVLECGAGRIEIRALGCWELIAGKRPPLGERLESLFEQCGALLREWNPRWIGFEKAVTFKNMSSALTLSEARGVIRLAAFSALDSADQRIIELSPTSVKKEASGFGQSTKGTVRKGLALRFRNLEQFVEGADLPADAFDALAIAWTAWILKGRYGRSDSRSGNPSGERSL